MVTQDQDLCKEKILQAAQIMHEEEIDLWLTLTRETAEHADPVHPFIIDSHVVWESAFLIHKSGKTIAIVGSLDAASIRNRGLYSDVHGYDQDIAPVLLTAISELDPKTIAINYSQSINTADGLTLGLYLSLTKDYLKNTVYVERLTSAENLIAKLRGRKTNEEIRRIKTAIRETEDILRKVCGSLRIGCTEREVFEAIRRELVSRGHGDAWSAEGNPGVDIGQGSHQGHGGPGNRVASPGDVLHVDFGARVNGYSADLQRVWYFRDRGDTIPKDVKDAFTTVKDAIEAAAGILKPGVEGWVVDKAARDVLTSRGYPEFNHALGHQLGRMAHDGGSLLGPRWPRYGNRPYGVVEEGNVFTLELGIYTSRGYVSLEDDVVVTSSGCEFLSNPQDEIWLIGS